MIYAKCQKLHHSSFKAAVRRLTVYSIALTFSSIKSILSLDKAYCDTIVYQATIQKLLYAPQIIIQLLGQSRTYNFKISFI